MNKTRSEFFDSRDKYLSFVHTTDEKIRIAFYLAATQLKSIPPGNNGVPFHILDAGTGEGTVIATFLTALHKRMPQTPILMTGKEISIDDVCILLGYLPDRFAEHPALAVRLTNMSYRELNALPATQYTQLTKTLRGETSHDFGLQLMNMSDLVKKYWALNAHDGRLVPQRKVMLTIYRADHKPLLQPLLAAAREQPYDFIIASQPFRLRRPPAQVADTVIAPLLQLLGGGGRMVLVYSSGRDFSRALLRQLYPAIKPYTYAAPARLLAAVRRRPAAAGVRIRTDTLRYGFINLYLGRREFSLGNMLSLWKAVTYVGQLSDAETAATPFNRRLEKLMRARLAKIKDMTFVNNVVVFRKPRR